MRTLLQMSLTGCCCVPAVLAVRFLLIKVLHSPRRYVYYLWLVVFLNLCLPYSLRVPVSFVPEWLSRPAVFFSVETESGGDASVSEAGADAKAGNDAEVGDDTEEEENSDNRTAAGPDDAVGLAAIGTRVGNQLQIPVHIEILLESARQKAANAVAAILSWPGLFGVWLAGLFLVLIYQGIVTFRMYRQVRAGRRAEGKERIYIVRNLPSPCLWGLFRPVICLPERLEETERDYILCHERCHKRRGDHIAKWISSFCGKGMTWLSAFRSLMRKVNGYFIWLRITATGS